jgi:hypothetical protein
VLARPHFVHLGRIADRLDLEALIAKVADQQIPQTDVVIDDEKAVMSVVHWAKDKRTFAAGMRAMVTSFFSGEGGNKLLQSLQKSRALTWRSDATIRSLKRRRLQMLVRRRILHLMFTLAASIGFAGAVHAQLPPDQRRQMRQEMREQWQQAPPEDRQRLRDERRERWQQMPQEDRQRMRDEMRGRRDEFGGQGMRYGGGFRGGRP